MTYYAMILQSSVKVSAAMSILFWSIILTFLCLIIFCFHSILRCIIWILALEDGFKPCKILQQFQEDKGTIFLNKYPNKHRQGNRHKMEIKNFTGRKKWSVDASAGAWMNKKWGHLYPFSAWLTSVEVWVSAPYIRAILSPASCNPPLFHPF